MSGQIIIAKTSSQKYLWASQSHFPTCHHILYSTSDTVKQVAFPWAEFFITSSFFQKTATFKRDQIHLSSFVRDR